MVTAHKTTALPLALAYAALIVYASLFPFAGWRDQGMAPWAFVTAPWPKYWTGFDFGINVVGYAPIGFLGVLVLLRSYPRIGAWMALIGATAAGAALSFTMEMLQTYLPARIPSNIDWGLNSLGVLGGALLALGLERLSIVAGWNRARSAWFVDDARGALVLIILWPAALLYPAPVAFGLGQVFERLEATIAQWLLDTPFIEWMPLREFELEPLVPAAELLCVMLGALAPCLLAFTVTPLIRRRALALAGVLAIGILASALSAALSWGPEHAWAWLGMPAKVGIVAAMLAAGTLLAAPRRLCATLALVVVLVQLGLLNQAPENAYFAQTLATWEQGRFIRFHGFAQWLGWLWPFAVVGYLLRVLSRDKRQT